MLPITMQKVKAMTIIELLVVIFILGVGILSISVLLSRSMSTTQQVHIQSTATILAREGIEMVYNVRDTNTLLWYEWNCAQRIQWQACTTHMRTWGNETHFFTIDGWLSKDKQITMSGIVWWNFDDLFKDSKLYLTSKDIWWTIITWYSHQSDHTKNTQFARYISFTGMNDLPKDLITNNDIHHISSIVLYKLSDTQTGQIMLESFITNQE